MKTNALLIEPKKNISLTELTLEQKNSEDILIEWEISAVCNSERRRFNLTKSATDTEPFIGGHEAVGFIKEDPYFQKKYVLLPHSNCVTKNLKEKCLNCEKGKENLCSNMKHAGLDQNEPSGFSNNMFVSRSQLFDVTGIENDLSVFLEPLSCVLRSWEISQSNLNDDELKIGIIGGGPIGCMHALYVNKINSSSEITIVDNNSKRRKTLNTIFQKFDNITIACGVSENQFDITVMAASDSSAYQSSVQSLKKRGRLILFSGFNETHYNENSIVPEIIHRNEFTHYTNDIIMVGSSGYTFENIIESKRLLNNFSQLRTIVTGRVYGLNSREIFLNDGSVQKHDEPILIKDIRGDLYNHIKIQYHNNQLSDLQL